MKWMAHSLSTIIFDVIVALGKSMIRLKIEIWFTSAGGKYTNVHLVGFEFLSGKSGKW